MARSSWAAELIGLFRRHFFLVAALVVLAVMIVAGGFKLATMKSGGGQGGPGGPQAAAGRPGGPGAAGGRGGPGGRGGFGGFGGPAMVSAAVVQPRIFQDNLEVLGVAKGRRSVTLTAATTQLIERVRFADGQTVRQGAVLVELKNTEQDAGIAQSQAKLAQAEREYQRWKTLADKGFASKSAVDQYQAAWLSAKADLAAARARQNDRLIRAPFAGVVGLSDVAPGALVNPGAPIVTLDDLSAVRVDFQVPEQYLSQIHEGQAIDAAVEAYPGQKIRGRIQRIDTRVDERTRAITARAEFPNPDHRLKPGMLMRVSISRGQRQALAAPETAVSVQGDSAFVYVIRQMGERAIAEQRPVVTGLRQDNFVEILDGLQPGEHVISDGLNKVQPGQPVRVAGGPGGGAGGFAQTPEMMAARQAMMQACGADMQKLCAGQQGREAFMCLRENSAKASGACQAAMAKARPPGGAQAAPVAAAAPGPGGQGGFQPTPQMMAARQAMMQACGADMQKLCAGQQGREAFMCLRQNAAQASAGCQAAMAKARPPGQAPS
jgi:membrane fusion protein (multidrug efflux system)